MTEFGVERETVDFDIGIDFLGDRFQGLQMRIWIAISESVICDQTEALVQKGLEFWVHGVSYLDRGGAEITVERREESKFWSSKLNKKADIRYARTAGRETRVSSSMSFTRCENHCRSALKHIIFKT